MDVKKIQELLFEQLQADGYKKGRSWKGYEVYVPTYEQDTYTGFPLVVLSREGETRVCTVDESIEYLEYCQSKQ